MLYRRRLVPLLVMALGWLSGCMVLKTEVSWRSSNAEIMRQSRQPQGPFVQAELSRQPHLFVLPFAFVSYANRGFGLAFYFSSSHPTGRLDSLRYTVYNASGDALAAGRTSLGKPLKRSTVSPEPRRGSLYFASHNTPYTLRLPIRQDSVVRVDFQLYATDSAGQSRVWRYDDYLLQRNGRRVGSFL